jgi:predicted phage terminase large subunit-like protein
MILIEEAGPGLQLLQEMKSHPEPGVPVPIGIRPDCDKLQRMEAQSARFEAGQVILPDDAAWLADLLHELLGFPNARHDDQVDSVSQFLNWAESRPPPVKCPMPISILKDPEDRLRF